MQCTTCRSEADHYCRVCHTASCAQCCMVREAVLGLPHTEVEDNERLCYESQGGWGE